MKSNIYLMKITATLAMIILLSGCATGSVYKQSDWSNSNDESDWDIDSVVCLEYSEHLTVDDQEKIAEIQATAAEAASSVGGSLDTVAAVTDNEYLGYASSIVSAFSTSKSVTAEEQVKQDKFAKCMKDKNWAE